MGSIPYPATAELTIAILGLFYLFNPPAEF